VRHAEGSIQPVSDPGIEIDLNDDRRRQQRDDERLLDDLLALESEQQHQRRQQRDVLPLRLEIVGVAGRYARSLRS